jgi:hypothetical protein
MTMLVLQIIFTVVLVLLILYLFNLEELAIKFIAVAVALVYCGFMLGVGFHIAALVVQMVTL